MKLDRWDVWALVELGEGDYSVDEVRAKAARMRRNWWTRCFYRFKHDPLAIFRPLDYWN